jgi:hypothetical protein
MASPAEMARRYGPETTRSVSVADEAARAGDARDGSCVRAAGSRRMRLALSGEPRNQDGRDLN